MKIILGIVGVLLLMMAGAVYANAESAMHQITGASIGVAGAVMFAGAGIIEAIHGIPLNQAQYDARSKKGVDAKAKAAAEQAA